MALGSGGDGAYGDSADLAWGEEVGPGVVGYGGTASVSDGEGDSGVVVDGVCGCS